MTINCPTRCIATETLHTESGVTYTKGIYERTTARGIATVEQITRQAPYDETKYHWAQRNIDMDLCPWQIRRSGKLVITLAPICTVEQVVEKLAELDAAKHLRRTGGIY